MTEPVTETRGKSSEDRKDDDDDDDETSWSK